MKTGGKIDIKTNLIARHFVPTGTGYKEILDDYREVKDKVITDVFVQNIVDSLKDSTGTAIPYTNWNDYKYHDSGTSGAAQAATQTALGTACGEARDTGTQVAGTAAYIYSSVATHTYAGAFTIMEHGLFNASTVGTLADRTNFGGITVAANDMIQFTFTISFPSGG